MAEEELVKVELRDGFYRDSVGKVVLAIIGICLAIILLSAISIYIYIDKPPPVVFPVADEFRVLPPIPLDQPYINLNLKGLRNPTLVYSDLLQWVANVVLNSFNYDYINYKDQLESAHQYFTDDGWKIFLNQLNIYANYNNVQANRLFVNGAPAGAPFVIRSGLLTGKYAWWVQMPIMITYQGMKTPPNKALTLQILVVRVSTLNNLNGVAIDNVVVVNGISSGTGT